MERYLASTTRTDVNEECIKLLAEEIFNRQIPRPLVDFHVLDLTAPHQPEYFESESGYHILVFQQLMIFMRFEDAPTIQL